MSATGFQVSNLDSIAKARVATFTADDWTTINYNDPGSDWFVGQWLPVARETLAAATGWEASSPQMDQAIGKLLPVLHTECALGTPPNALPMLWGMKRCAA